MKACCSAMDRTELDAYVTGSLASLTCGAEGLRLASEGDVGAVGAWCRHWTGLLNAIRAPLKLEAPYQTELVLWPAVNATQSLEEIRAEMVRAAVGCRELALLVRELGGTREDGGETAVAVSWSENTAPGSTYVGAGRRFEGAIRLRQLIEPARDSLTVIDPYMDDGTFTLAAAAHSGVSRRFLTSNHRSERREVTDAWTNWRGSWEGESQCLTGSELPTLPTPVRRWGGIPHRLFPEGLRVAPHFLQDAPDRRTTQHREPD